MGAGRRGDPRIGMMLFAYREIIASAPSVMQPGEHGPLTLPEIDQAAELMDRLGAEIEQERTAEQDR